MSQLLANLCPALGRLKMVFGGVPMGLLSHGELQNASGVLGGRIFGSHKRFPTE
jgi:hypothetical protein